MHRSVFKSLPNNYKGLVGFWQYKKASQAINTDKTISIQRVLVHCHHQAAHFTRV